MLDKIKKYYLSPNTNILNILFYNLNLGFFSLYFLIMTDHEWQKKISFISHMKEYCVFEKQALSIIEFTVITTRISIIKQENG